MTLIYRFDARLILNMSESMNMPLKTNKPVADALPDSLQKESPKSLNIWGNVVQRAR
jgi:hypothetical protein